MIAIEGSFYDGERSRAHRAELELGDAKTIRVTLLDERDGDGLPRRFELPLSRIEISDRIGSIPRRLVLPGIGIFETADNDGVDRALAAHGRSPGFVHWLEQRWPIAIASLLVVALGSVLFVRFGVPALAEFAARQLPLSVDRVIGAQTLDVLDQILLDPSELTVPRRQALQARFRAMTAPLEGGHTYRLEHRSAEALGPNALALPSGIIVMTDELVALAKDDDELVAVLAHEIGHVRGRHALRQLLQTSGVSAIAFALLGDVSSASALFGAVPALVQAKHSRDFEREADGFAKGWMVRNGIASERFDAILCRMQASAGEDEEDGLVRFLSTHPTMNERAHCDGNWVPHLVIVEKDEENEGGAHDDLDLRDGVLRDLKEQAARDAREEIRRASEALSTGGATEPPL